MADNKQNLRHSKGAVKQVRACKYRGYSTTTTSGTDMLIPISILQEKKSKFKKRMFK
jgi:hypothetical protein